MNLKTIFTVLAASCISCLAAQEAPNKKDASGKKQGFWIKYDDNQKKMYEGNFVNDIPVGKFTYYYDSGVPWSISVFSENGKVARTQMFTAGGKLSGEGKYIDQKKDSLWKFYDDEGKLIADEFYIKGVKNGNARVYYKNGQIAEDRTWKNGKQNGPCKKYFENGQIKYIGQYIDDKVEGKVVMYQVNGKVDAEGVYKNDLKDGPWKYYKEDGTLKRTDIYLNGRLQGPDKEIVPKEQQDKEKKQFEQFEIKDPYQERYSPE